MSLFSVGYHLRHVRPSDGCKSACKWWRQLNSMRPSFRQRRLGPVPAACRTRILQCVVQYQQQWTGLNKTDATLSLLLTGGVAYPAYRVNPSGSSAKRFWRQFSAHTEVEGAVHHGWSCTGWTYILRALRPRSWSLCSGLLLAGGRTLKFMIAQENAKAEEQEFSAATYRRLAGVCNKCSLNSLNWACTSASNTPIALGLWSDFFAAAELMTYCIVYNSYATAMSVFMFLCHVGKTRTEMVTADLTSITRKLRCTQNCLSP